MHKNYGLWVIVGLVSILAFFLFKTFWQYLAFSFIFALLFHKLFKRLARKMHPNLAATIIVVGILLLLVIPTIYIITQAVKQVPGAYTNFINALSKEEIPGVLGFSADQTLDFITRGAEAVRENVLANGAGYLNQMTNILLGLFLMFMTTFFLLRDGEKMYDYVVHTLPVRKHNTREFSAKMLTIVNAVLLGQLVTAVIQGILAGLVFWILGVPNALLLGILTVLLSIIPMLGPFLVYIPVAIYLFFTAPLWKAVVLLGFGTIILSQIDNVIRPYIAHRTAAIHPLTVIIGVVAGLKLWGLIGFILGPLVLAAFFALYEFSMTGDETALQKKTGKTQ
jgi:predicted PurR-regulated permease PerM